LKKVRTGVIGCGHIAEQAHLPNLLGCPLAELVAAADTRKERLIAVRQKFGVKNLYEDYHDMLKEDLIDAVSICVPTFLHSQVSVDASEAGKHILCEKPIAATLDDADRMISAARKNDVKLMIGHYLRFLPNHKLAKEWAQKGKIGKVYFVRAQFASSGPYGTLGMTSPFYFDPEKGGGVLLDAGSHLADMLLWMFGDIAGVHAYIGTHMNKINQADDVASVSLKFERGMVGEIFASWVSIQNWHLMTDYNNIQILGTEGSMHSDCMGPYLSYFNEKSLVCRLKGMIRLTPMDLDPKVPFIARDYAYKKEIDSFVGCIAKDKEPLITGEDGRRALKVIIDAHKSAKGLLC